MQALQEIRSIYVRDEYANKVKAAVREYLEEMEGKTAEVEDTLYFNHSAIPDFVIRWDGGQKRRDFYIRASYAEIVAADEVVQIRSGDPVFMSIDTKQSFQEAGFELSPVSLAHEARKSGHTLLTDPSAISEISSSADKVDPLATLMKSNFLRGARGLVDEPVAEALIGARSRLEEGRVGDLIKEKFFEDAAFRMERTAAIMQWAKSGSGQDGPLESVLHGSMSLEELQSILPWILRESRAPHDPNFWSQLGGMMTLEQLEEMAADIEGMNITPLVQANAHRWSAKRGYLGLNISNEEAPRDGYWSFDHGTLGLNLQGLRIRLSVSGHKLRSRPGRSSLRWESVKQVLRDYRLQSVSLSGIERSLAIEAKASNDLNADVSKIADSVEDDYFIDRVALQIPSPGQEEPASVDVDFAGSLVTADRPAELASLTRVVLDVVGVEYKEERLSAMLDRATSIRYTSEVEPSVLDFRLGARDDYEHP